MKPANVIPFGKVVEWLILITLQLRKFLTGAGGRTHRRSFANQSCRPVRGVHRKKHLGPTGNPIPDSSIVLIKPRFVFWGLKWGMPIHGVCDQCHRELRKFEFLKVFVSTQRPITVDYSYIARLLEDLQAREQRFQRWAIGCYVLGYSTIFAGLAYAILRPLLAPSDFTNTREAVCAGIHAAIAIGFLVAASKFAFVMGKSFMVEALRNHNRTHAIKFGEFYLKTFGEHASWNELKEAFQHWNLDTGSTFKDQKEESIDPQVMKTLLEPLKNNKK